MATIKPIPLIKLFVRRKVPLVPSKTFTTQSMSSAWFIKKVVPDVIDDVPLYKLAVQYSKVNINEGTIVKPIQVKDVPDVSWKVRNESALYTLCMVDPDAPSRSKPKMREWQHWLVVNIPGNVVEKGNCFTNEVLGCG